MVNKCAYSSQGDFETGNYQVAICSYDESSKTARIVIMREASNKELISACGQDPSLAGSSS
jgi:hypothetical protein